MLDETESGETYDKIAAQALGLAKGVRRRGRPGGLGLEVEARLVRLAMSESMTISQLAKELGLSIRVVQYHLRRLGLERMVKGKSGRVPEGPRPRRAVRVSRRIAAHEV